MIIAMGTMKNTNIYHLTIFNFFSFLYEVLIHTGKYNKIVIIKKKNKTKLNKYKIDVKEFLITFHLTFTLFFSFIFSIPFNFDRNPFFFVNNLLK